MPPVRLLSVGRLVPKKGYAGAAGGAGAAAGRICDWRFPHIGGGPLER